jgi:hypothetical protein
VNILFKRYDGEIFKLAESARNTFGERADEERSEGGSRRVGRAG